MKLKLVISIIAMFLSLLNCKAQKETPTAIVIEYDYWDYTGRIYIAADELNIQRATTLDKDKLNNPSLRTIQKFTIGTEALRNICNIIGSSWNTENTVSNNSRLFNISIIKANKIETTYYLNNEKDINRFFINVYDALKGYECEECIKLKEVLQSFIDES